MEQITFTGTIRAVIGNRQGTTSKGDWRMTEYLLENTEGQYPKRLAAEVWGDKIDALNLQVGEQVTAYLDIESRPWRGKDGIEHWSTSVRIWKVDRGQTDAPQEIGKPRNTTFKGVVGVPSDPPICTTGNPLKGTPDTNDEPEDKLPF
jgi:hypothetical protein